MAHWLCKALQAVLTFIILFKKAEGYYRVSKVCRTLPPPQDGYFTNGVCDGIINDACTVECNSGYNLRGSANRLCASNGLWTGEQAVCIKCDFQCSKDATCLPKSIICDGKNDCDDASDELNCPNDVEKIIGATYAKRRLLKWFLARRKDATTVNKWGYRLPRVATAVYLADPNFFQAGNKTGEEITYELSLQLLSKLSSSKQLSSQELAMYINALLVSCIDPKNFYGHNLVKRLREQVELKDYTNPLEMIALCNAKDNMTSADVERISNAYDSLHRAFWTDTQAFAVMALSCVSSLPNLNIDLRVLRDMSSELKKRQHLNGTVDNLKSTALVVQALIASNNYARDFDFNAAVKTMIQQQKADGSFPSFLDAYYVLPALSYRSLVSINTTHCINPIQAEDESLNELQSQKGELIQISYTIFIGPEVDLTRTWKFKVPMKSTLYDVMETVKKLDSKYTVHYNVFDGKPYPTAVFNTEDDPERGLFWFVYKQETEINAKPRLIEASPVDTYIQENEQLILWYKYGEWSGKAEKVPVENSTLSESDP